MSESIMQGFADWARDKPPLPAVLAIAAAGSADEVDRLMLAVREEPGRWPKLAPGKHDVWDRYWQSPEAWAIDFAHSILPWDDDEEGEAEEQQAPRQVRLIVRLVAGEKPPRRLQAFFKELVNETTSREFNSAISYSRRVGRIAVAKAVRCFVLPPEQEEGWDEAAAIARFHALAAGDASVQFFFRVIAPTFVVHGDYPWRLFWRALAGGEPDFGVLEDLVRIDKRVIHHPWCRDLQEDPRWRQVFVRVMSGAVLSSPRKLSLKGCKYCLAGLIQQAFASCHCPITAPEVQRLYDLIARARGEGLRDASLPMTPASFLRNLSRHRDGWRVFPLADRKAFECVRAVLGRAA